MRFISILAAAAFLNVTVYAGENWPEFRGPTADGHADANGLPLTWSESENVRWKTAIHDKGWSSPVIWGKQVWMTTAREEGTELFAVCVDRDTGKITHDVRVFEIAKPFFCHRFNSYASPTPVIEQGRVYVHFGSAGTACLDTATGQILWTRQDLPCDHFRAAGSSPILAGDLLILTFDGVNVQYVAALDKATGKTIWKVDRNIAYSKPEADWHKAYATPRLIDVGGQTQLISPAAEATIAYEPRTGKEIWRVIHGGMNVAARPLYDHGKLYLVSGYSGKQLFSARPNGTGDITNHIEWTFKKGVPTRPSLILVNDLLYMVNDGGVLSCVDAKTGQQLAQNRIEKDFSASPIYAEGRIYFASEDGPVSVVEASKSLKILAVNKLDAGCMASPAAVGNALYLRTKTHLYRIEKKNGQAATR